MKNSLFYLMSGSVLILLLTFPVKGEECSDADSVCHHFWIGLDRIFVGRVTSISPVSERLNAREETSDSLKLRLKVVFAVDKSYSKYDEKRIEIQALGNDHQRPIAFEVGARYLVFAEPRGLSNRGWYVYPCGPTKHLSAASPDIAYLDRVHSLNPAADILDYRDQRVMHLGILQGRALSLPKPPYSELARAARTAGSVLVLVLLDEVGDVIRAKAVCGNPLLMKPAEAAAWQAKFTPTKVFGKPVKVSTLINYNFVSN